MLLLDFDETLWLRNSTQAFLDQARPRFVIAILLKILDVLRPWRLLPGTRSAHVWRDWLCVMLVVILAPWSLWTWRRVAPDLALAHVNTDLWMILRRHPDRPVWVVSNGFRCIVGPLLRGLGDPRLGMLASPLLTGPRWRLEGKRLQVERLLGQEVLGRAIVVTDNGEDDDLLGACAHGFRCRWDGARYIQAMSDVYVPFDYLENVKRPGKKHFVKIVLADDLIAVWLAYIWTASDPLVGAVVLLLLHLAFWVVYEIGYAENDRLGYQRERDPVLSDAFHRRRHSFSEVGAWGFATFFSMAALAIAVFMHLDWRDPLAAVSLPMQQPAVDAGILLVVWMVYLGLTRGLFRVYNLLDKKSRVLPFFLLQAAKLVGFAVWLELPLVGVAVIVAYTVTRWVPYIMYRHTSGLDAWEFATHRYRLMLFLVMAGLLGVAADPLPEGYFVQVAVVTSWFLWKVRREISWADRSAGKVAPARRGVPAAALRGPMQG